MTSEMHGSIHLPALPLANDFVASFRLVFSSLSSACCSQFSARHCCLSSSSRCSCIFFLLSSTIRAASFTVSLFFLSGLCPSHLMQSMSLRCFSDDLHQRRPLCFFDGCFLPQWMRRPYLHPRLDCSDVVAFQRQRTIVFFQMDKRRSHASHTSERMRAWRGTTLTTAESCLAQLPHFLSWASTWRTCWPGHRLCSSPAPRLTESVPVSRRLGGSESSKMESQTCGMEASRDVRMILCTTVE